MQKYQILVAFICTINSFTAIAQDLVLKEQPKEIKKNEGWDFLLSPGLSFSIGNSNNVIGQDEGCMLTLGLNLTAEANLRKKQHEVRNSLTINETFSRNPVLEELVKTTDIFEFESIYLFHIIDWFGPYINLSVDTNMLPGFDTRGQETSWQVEEQESRKGTKLKLTNAFQPLIIKESIGFFVTPYNKKELRVEIGLGFGGVHTIAQNALALHDNDDTEDKIEVIELHDVNQAGVEFSVNMWGEICEKKFIYKIGAKSIMPFVDDLNEKNGRNVGELTNLDFNATLSYKFLKWLSLDYIFRAIRTPQLLDDFQIQNNLLLTASYSFFGVKKE